MSALQLSQVGLARFTQVAGSALDVQRECQFAHSIVAANKDLRAVDPVSIEEAIIQAGSMHLSLNPALAHAYLVPRGGRAYLHPGYRGLVHLAIAGGAATMMAAELVYQADTFEYYGPVEKPRHVQTMKAEERSFDLVIGAYAVARLPDGTWLCAYTDRATINTTRELAAGRSLMWSSFPSEGAKKVALRRLVKHLHASPQMLQAMTQLDSVEGVDFTQANPQIEATEAAEAADTAEALVNGEQLAQLQSLAARAGVDEARIAGVYQVKSLAALPFARLDTVVSRLEANLKLKQT